MPLTHTEAYDAIVAEFIDKWTDNTVTVYYDDDTADPPDGTTSWIRVSVQFNAGTQASLGGVGNRVFRNFGIVFVQLFTHLETSMNVAIGLAEDIKNIFEGKHLSSAWFWNTSIKSAGIDGKWRMHVITSEFRFDEIR